MFLTRSTTPQISNQIDATVNVHLKTSPKEPKNGTCAGPKSLEVVRVGGGVQI